MVSLDGHVYNAGGHIMDKEQLLVVPLIMKTPCTVGPLLPEDDGVNDFHRHFAVFHEGNLYD